MNIRIVKVLSRLKLAFYLIHLKREKIIVFAAVTFVSSFAMAQDQQELGAVPVDNPSFASGLHLNVGAVIADVDTTVASFLRPSGVGGSVSLEDIGVDTDATIPFLEARWLSSGRWRFGFAFSHLDLDGDRTVDIEFDYQDVTIGAGAQVLSDFQQNFYNGSIGYAFVKRPDIEVGGLLALYAVDVEASITASGNVTVDGELVADGSVTRSISSVIPAGALGLYGKVALTNNVTLGGQVEFISASYEEYSGDILRLDADLTYWFSDAVSFGVGYRYTELNLDVDEDRRSDRYDVSTSGIRVFAGFLF